MMPEPSFAKIEAVRVALELGGDIDAVDDNGETAMHGAAYKHAPAAVTYLAEQGARIEVWNRENARGWTPLKIVEGVQRGMNIISSPETEVAVRAVMERAGVPPPALP
jgi:ankyrin repeat protein